MGNEANIKEGSETQMAKKFLTEVEVSAMIGRAVSTLNNDRYYKRGLPYVAIRKRLKTGWLPGRSGQQIHNLYQFETEEWSNGDAMRDLLSGIIFGPEISHS